MRGPPSRVANESHSVDSFLAVPAPGGRERTPGAPQRQTRGSYSSAPGAHSPLSYYPRHDTVEDQHDIGNAPAPQYSPAVARPSEMYPPAHAYDPEGSPLAVPNQRQQYGTLARGQPVDPRNVDECNRMHTTTTGAMPSAARQQPHAGQRHYGSYSDDAMVHGNIGAASRHAGHRGHGPGPQQGYYYGGPSGMVDADDGYMGARHGSAESRVEHHDMRRASSPVPAAGAAVRPSHDLGAHYHRNEHQPYYGEGNTTLDRTGPRQPSGPGFARGSHEDTGSHMHVDPQYARDQQQQRYGDGMDPGIPGAKSRLASHEGGHKYSPGTSTDHQYPYPHDNSKSGYRTSAAGTAQSSPSLHEPSTSQGLHSDSRVIGEGVNSSTTTSDASSGRAQQSTATKARAIMGTTTCPSAGLAAGRHQPNSTSKGVRGSASSGPAGDDIMVESRGDKGTAQGDAASSPRDDSTPSPSIMGPLSAKRPYKCTQCQRRFAHASTLSAHKMSHRSDRRPHVCTHPGCGKSFGRSYTLNMHKRTHTGERPYQCPFPECGKTFTQSGSRNTHIRALHGVTDVAGVLARAGMADGGSGGRTSGGGGPGSKSTSAEGGGSASSELEADDQELEEEEADEE